MKLRKWTILAILAYLPGFAGAANDPEGVLWENRAHPRFGTPYAVDAEDNVVVAVGEVDPNPYKLKTFDWFARAYDARTGVTLWKDRLDVAGEYDVASAVAVHAGRAFVAGVTVNQELQDSFVVRAYGLKNGTLLWEKSVVNGIANAVVADAEQLYVSGSYYDATTGSVIGALFALDARSGATLWESTTASTDDPKENPNRFAFGSAVRVEGERVFVVGQISTSGTASGVSIYAQAHDRETGSQLWEQQIPDAQVGPTDTIPIAVAGDWLAIGGGEQNQNPDLPWDYRVTTLNVRTGALAWTDQVHRQAGGLAAGLGFGAGKLFAYGWDCDDTVSNCHGEVRAYDPKTGVLQWEHRFTGPGGDITTPIPGPAFAVRGNQVFLGTSLADVQGDDYVWTVRAYNGKDGSVRWQSQTDDGAGSIDGIMGLKLMGDRLYAAGTAGRPDGGSAFTLRAYQIDDAAACDADGVSDE